MIHLNYMIILILLLIIHLKFFQFKGGKIITPNYLHFDTVNTTTQLNSTKTNNSNI